MRKDSRDSGGEGGSQKVARRNNEGVQQRKNAKAGRGREVGTAWGGRARQKAK